MSIPQLILNAILGIICVCIAFWMITERVSSKIRASQYWVCGFIAYHFFIISAFYFLAPIFSS